MPFRLVGAGFQWLGTFPLCRRDFPGLLPLVLLRVLVGTSSTQLFICCSLVDAACCCLFDVVHHVPLYFVVSVCPFFVLRLNFGT